MDKIIKNGVSATGTRLMARMLFFHPEATGNMESNCFLCPSFSHSRTLPFSLSSQLSHSPHSLPETSDGFKGRLDY